MCGDCCTLTEGGTTTWAICLDCLDCDRRKGRSLGGAWRSLGVWLIGILVVLTSIVVLLEWLAPR